ncbi:MAG: 30S ribosomal protein S3 [Deltaproteobacteria bacterium]|nr:30S ribosomal protein S3 [Deltaproteobacteria bacterium]
MGQKTHPIGFRLGITKTWTSRWFAARKDYAKLVHEDVFFRKLIKERLYNAGIAKIDIERAAEKVKIAIWTARPGLVIGKKGSGIDALAAELQRFTPHQVVLNIQEVRKPEVDSQLVAENVAMQLERRVSFRRAIKKAVQTALKLGAEGIKIHVSGRLGGAEIARAEWYREGRVPLHTLRADVDFGFAEAKTTYGQIGVKAWVYKGEVL